MSRIVKASLLLVIVAFVLSSCANQDTPQVNSTAPATRPQEMTNSNGPGTTGTPQNTTGMRRHANRPRQATGRPGSGM